MKPNHWKKMLVLFSAYLGELQQKIKDENGCQSKLWKLNENNQSCAVVLVSSSQIQAPV